MSKLQESINTFRIKINSQKKVQEGDAAQHSEKFPPFFRFTLEEQMLFAKRLAIMLKAGVPILESLDMLKRQTTSKSANHIVSDLHKGVFHGQYLHMRMEKYRQFMGDFAINIIRVGEVSGTLHQSLDYLAQEIKKKRELKRKVVGALIYPMFIVCATVGITIMLTVFIFPKILPILQGFKGQLPFTTRTLIFLSNLLISKGWLIALVVVAFGVAFAWARKLESFRLKIDQFLLRVPILGKLFVYYNTANFCRTLGVLLKSDVRIIEAVNITSKTSANLAYKKEFSALCENITRGEKLADFFEGNIRMFPAIVGQMVNVGESTGKLSDSLLYLAEIYESEVDEITKNLSTSIEPILMVFMGFIVGFIAMSIIVPIYSLTQSLTR